MTPSLTPIDALGPRLLRLGAYCFFGAVIAVAVLLIVSTFPIAGSFRIMTVESGSMEPAIGAGSIVVVRPGQTYKIGDIISFEGGFRDRRGRPLPVTHRIVEMRVDRGSPVYITKGDANNAPDARELRERAVIGKVLLTVPFVGYAIDAARTPWGFLALIVIPAAIIAFDQAKSIWQEVRAILVRRRTRAPNGAWRRT